MTPMIHKDQPTIFGSGVIAALSSRRDGNMRFGGDNDELVRKNREAFLQRVGIDIRNTSLVRITFDVDDFARYRIVKDADKTRGITAYEEIEPADALITDQPGHALFLLLADCVGAIMHDEKNGILMISHLGRHSVEINGAVKSVRYLHDNFGTNPADLKVWLSPGVGNATYPLQKFDSKGLHEVIVAQLLSAGVKRNNIEQTAIDTAISEDYYSHSEFLKGKQDGPARFAIVAMMVAQGESAN
jgi:hypothetical protein